MMTQWPKIYKYIYIVHHNHRNCFAIKTSSGLHNIQYQLEILQLLEYKNINGKSFNYVVYYMISQNKYTFFFEASITLSLEYPCIQILHTSQTKVPTEILKIQFVS